MGSRELKIHGLYFALAFEERLMEELRRHPHLNNPSLQQHKDAVWVLVFISFRGLSYFHTTPFANQGRSGGVL